jgi:hypothetical protein
MPTLLEEDASQEGWMEAMQPMRNISDGISAADSVPGIASAVPLGADARDAQEPGPSAEGDMEIGVPDFFLGTSFAVDEILLGMNVLTAKVKALKEGNTNKASVTQKLQAESVAKTAGQIQLLADMLARVTIAHINRKPRG